MMLKFFSSLLAISVLLFTVGRANAQGETDFSGGLFPNLSISGFADDTSEPASWTARYFIGEKAGEGRIDVEVTLAKGWHVYSTTQPKGGPLPTKLAIVTPPEVKATSAFKADREPNRSVSTEFKGLTVEEYESKVTWSAPIVFPANYSGPISVEVDALVCKSDGSCLPVEETVEASLVVNDAPKIAENPATMAPALDEVAAGSSFREPDYAIQWRGTISPSEVTIGGSAVLTLTAVPDAPFHIYPAAIDDANSSTNFVVSEKSGLRIGKPSTQAKTISELIVPSLPPVKYHQGTVTWTLPIEVPKTAMLGKHPIELLVAYQACDAARCLLPQGIRVAANLEVVGSEAASDKPAPVQITTTDVGKVLDAAATTRWVDDISTDSKPQPLQDVPAAVDQAAAKDAKVPAAIQQPAVGDPHSTVAAPIVSTLTEPAASFPYVLLLAFAGGVILNVMPCVLPVVGLKIMSFVKQAGEDRGRVFALNIVYVLGILSVFALLAGLAVVLSFSWGEQFTYFPVRLGLALALFALALSYLGVWEIPVPGMAAGKASQELQSREGFVGAFSKGVFATILATPCSGPLLGYILGLTISLTATQTIIVIMSVGIGMSLPYLIIGAKPALVSWLPKPGPWMETLKQFLAFLFLGTVAFFFAGFNDVDRVPVFVSLIGVWFGCWLIGLVPNWESMNKRITAWISGIAAATAIGIAAFTYLAPGEKVLQWEPYNEARLQQLHREGRTVMIDFTASWCVNCIVNYNVAINTAPTKKLIEELDAVPMLADWTDRDAQIKSKLAELQSRSIPVLAIFPGAKPGEPIVLRDLVSQHDVLTALQQAGPSVAPTRVVGSDMPTKNLDLPTKNLQTAVDDQRTVPRIGFVAGRLAE